MSQLSTIVEKLSDWLWPRHCLGCQRGGTWLCPPCEERLPREIESPAEWIYSSLSYSTPLTRQLIRYLKYRGARELGQILGRLIYQDWVERAAEESQFFAPGEPWLVVPIPPSPGRSRERWYHPAELLAREVARQDETNFHFATLLKKVRRTAPQTALPRRSRLGNLRGAFVVTNPQHTKRQKVIIIDDVTTTGATLSEARRALRAAGATRVVALTAAHG